LKFRALIIFSLGNLLLSDLIRISLKICCVLLSENCNFQVFCLLLLWRVFFARCRCMSAVVSTKVWDVRTWISAKTLQTTVCATRSTLNNSWSPLRQVCRFLLCSGIRNGLKLLVRILFFNSSMFVNLCFSFFSWLEWPRNFFSMSFLLSECG